MHEHAVQNPSREATLRGERHILGAAAASMALSVALFFSGEREMGIFVGIWVPSILSLGTFLKTGRT